MSSLLYPQQDRRSGPVSSSGPEREPSEQTRLLCLLVKTQPEGQATLQYIALVLSSLTYETREEATRFLCMCLWGLARDYIRTSALTLRSLCLSWISDPLFQELDPSLCLIFFLCVCALCFSCTVQFHLLNNALMPSLLPSPIFCTRPLRHREVQWLSPGAPACMRWSQGSQSCLLPPQGAPSQDSA